MERKDVRNIVMSFLLGDGCLHYTSNRVSGALTIAHGIAQADYHAWKAQILSTCLNRDVKVRNSHKGEAIQLSVCFKRFKAWRKFIYPSGKKDVTRILKFINNPKLAVAIWLMDDGYCEPSFSKLADGTRKNYGARLRIFSCETPIEKQQMLIDWFSENLGVTPKLHLQKNNKRNKEYPFIKLNASDSLKLWKEIREFILQFKSMRNKFRHLEEIYQRRIV